MPVSINNTTLTFNDATTQTTAGVTSVGAGTGISSSGGLTPTIANTGVTSLTAGTGISLSGSTGGVTITSTATGTVTSVATGNGLSGGTITTTGTLIVACPTFNSVGSYCLVVNNSAEQVFTSGTNYSAGTGNNQLQSTAFCNPDGNYGIFRTNNLSGTWKWMSSTTATGGAQTNPNGLGCRVS